MKKLDIRFFLASLAALAVFGLHATETVIRLPFPLLGEHGGPPMGQDLGKEAEKRPLPQ